MGSIGKREEKAPWVDCFLKQNKNKTLHSPKILKGGWNSPILLHIQRMRKN
jgi:hypothetical protein